MSQNFNPALAGGILPTLSGPTSPQDDDLTPEGIGQIYIQTFMDSGNVNASNGYVAVATDPMLNGFELWAEFSI